MKSTLKLLVAIVAVVVVGATGLYSQSFTLLYDKDEMLATSMFRQYNGNLTHFPRGSADGYMVIDKYGNKQVYSAFSTGIDGVWNSWTELFIGPPYGLNNNYLYAINTYGMFEMKEYATNPKFTRHISFKDDWGIVNNTLAAPYVYGIAIVPDKNNPQKLNYAVITISDLRIISTDDGSIISIHPYPEEMTMITGYSGLKYTLDGNLWFLPYAATSIVRFNTITEEFEICDGKLSDFPINLVSVFDGIAGWRIYKTASNVQAPSYNKCISMLYYDSANNYCHYPVWAISKIDTIAGVAYGSNCLLRHKDGIWDTITINLPNTQYHKEKDYVIGDIFYMGGTKIAMTFTQLDYTTINNNREFVIYDISSREYTNIVMPEPSYDSEMLPICIRNYTYNDKNGLGILTKYSQFYFYDTETGIEEDILSYSKLYPNPATDNTTITLELQQASQVHISLNDVLGREIKQIYNAFTDAGTFTQSFTTTAIPKGIYYLKIFIGGDVKVEKVVVR
jgi:hypothetical protein